jgi:CMP-N,N'-diacetyllegionaminic acid synthase
MTVLAVVCARQGSKGVPGKNEALFKGEPLVAHTVATARDAGIFDAIVVSSDGERLLKLGHDAGADVLVRRPGRLATDGASKLDAIVHAVEVTESHLGARADIIVDLDVTTPLRLPADIIDAVALLNPPTVNRVFTASPARRSPYFNQAELVDGVPRLPCSVGEVVRRQDAPSVYDLSGAVYVWTRDALVTPRPLLQDDARLHVIPAARAWDIDDDLDLMIVRALEGGRP